MKFKGVFLLLPFLIFSCKSKNAILQRQQLESFNSVMVDTLFKDKISIRAILVDKDKVWYAGDKSRFGFYDLKTKSKLEHKIIKDTLEFEFRSIAQTSKSIFVLSVANPAVLYKIDKNDLEPKLVYQEINEKVFYDSMQFWNDKDGIAVGDPTEDCFSLLITRDGGDSWSKIPCDNLPKLADGEAFFAASNTNVIIKDSKIFIVSGGIKSRVFVSEDKGFSWNSYDTPFVQEQAMTGIFSADFYNENLGFAVGGNYDKQTDNSANKSITHDGGKTWKLVGVDDAFGYASCVQFIPNTNGNGLVTVGTSGVFYSNNQGNSWVKLLDDKDLHTIRFLNESTAFAAGRNKIIQIHFKK